MSVNNSSTHDYLNFDLLITRAGDAYRAYVIDAPGGDADATFTVPFPLHEISRLNRGTGTRRHLHLIAEPVIASPPSLRDLGRRLYDAVFRDEVRSVLIASQAEAQAEGCALRIRLRFSDDAIDLATLPWEILFDPEQQHFLALSEARPILRYLSLPRSRPPLQIKPPLTILAVLASPTDHARLDVEQEWQAIETALATLCTNGKVTLERLTLPTFETLRNRLLGEPVHVLHFVGHGLYAAERGEGALLFEDARRQSHLIPAQSLAILLHNHSSLRLVYLNACEGAIADQGNVFAGVAQTLVHQGVPAVVAMQDEITDDAAIQTARAFYTALAMGRPVDAALTQARVALATQENEEWAIPVLFSRSPDNRLFDVGETLPDPDCPYPGMRPFNEKQQKLFFGRDREIDDAVSRLAQHPFLTVVGPSGSGKSSLVYAGIIPSLRNSGRFGEGEWSIKILRPSDSRTADGKAAPMQALTQLLDLFPQSSGATLQSPTLLCIDQFEEVFTLADAVEAEQFLKALHALIKPAGKASNLYILLTVRADFYPEMMAMGPLWEAVKANRLELTPLGDDELWAAIVQPAAVVGVTVDEALVVELIHDAAGESGVLPLVQETLVLLWKKVESRQLKLKAYQAMADSGRTGIQVAIDRRANVVYNNLSDAAKPIARRIFLRLIQFGAGRADTRRQQTVAELRTSGDDYHCFEETLRTLVDSRLLTTSGEEDNPNRRVDISHEALIGGWVLLQTWIREKREAESTRRRLVEAAKQWLDAEKQGGLLDQYKLLEAETWLQSEYSNELGHSQGLTDLVNASKAAMWKVKTEKAEAERTRRRAWVLAGGLVLASLSIALVGWFWWQAKGSEARAMAAADVARKSEGIAISAKATAESAFGETAQLKDQIRADQLAQKALVLANDDSWPKVSLLLAVEAAKIVSPALPSTLSTLHSLLGQVGGQTIGNYQEPATSVAFSPDGHWLAGASEDNTILVWSLTQLNQPPIQLKGHSGPITNLAFSPDNRWLASASNDHTVRLWPTGEAMTSSIPLTYHEASVDVIAFSPDGHWLASGSKDYTVRLWTVWPQVSIEPVTFRAHHGYIEAIAFSPDSRLLASTGRDHTIHLWSTNSITTTSKFSVTLAGPWEWTNEISFSPDGRWLASADSDGNVRLWSTEDPTTEPRLLQGHSENVVTLAFSPNGHWLATGSTDKTVRLWNLSEEKSTSKILRGSLDDIFMIKFSPDSRFLAAARQNNSILLWDISNPSADPIRLKGHEGVIRYFAFSPDSQFLASASADATVRLWNMQHPMQEPFQIREHQGRINALAFSADERFFASASQDHTIKLRSMNQLDNTPIALVGHQGEVTSLAFDPNGQLLASTSEDKTLRIWPVAQAAITSTILMQSGGHLVVFSSDGKRLASDTDNNTLQVWLTENNFTGTEVSGATHQGRINALAFSPNNRLLATASEDRVVRLWSVANLKMQPYILNGHQEAVTAIAFSPDSRQLATAGRDNTVRLWSVEYPGTASRVLTDGHENDVTSVLFSKDGQWIASASNDKTIRVWYTQNLDAAPIVFRGHQDYISSLAFSPDSRFLASSGMDTDKTVLLWSVEHPENPPVQLFGHKDSVSVLIFSPTGSWLAGGGYDTNINLWTMDITQLNKFACQTAGRNLTQVEWELYFPDEPYRQTCLLP